MKIIFFGTPDFVTPVLTRLSENFDVVKVVRNEKDYQSIINNQSSIINKVDFFVVASFGQILPSKLLSVPKIAAINIHPSLLPKYRGASPIQTAILNGDTTTGVTFIKMDEKMDHGQVIEQFKAEIKPNDTFESLANELFKKAADRLPQVLKNYKEANLKSQDEEDATYTKLLTKQDGFIDLETLEIGNLKLDIKRAVRAFFPWPGVWTRSEIINHKSLIIKFLPQEKIQVEGKNPMTYKDFINGYPNGKLFLEKLFLI